MHEYDTVAYQTCGTFIVYGVPVENAFSETCRRKITSTKYHRLAIIMALYYCNYTETSVISEKFMIKAHQACGCKMRDAWVTQG
jgi:hypothetical protein